MTTKLFKRKTNSVNLYKKEQLLICLLLLCFVLCSFILPSYREPLPTDNVVELPEETIPERDSAENDSSVVESDDSDQTTDVPQMPETQKTLPETLTGDSTNTGDSSTPTMSEKTWVPPVYETIHHEAVYDTVRMVVCNYCSESFRTVGEFQIHKDANGG